MWYYAVYVIHSWMQCGVSEQVQKCTMMVWSQPWLHSTKLTSFTCEEMSDNVNRVRRKPGLGGHSAVDVSGYQVKHAVEFVVTYLNSKSDDLFSLELFQVVNGTQQVHPLSVLYYWHSYTIFL